MINASKLLTDSKNGFKTLSVSEKYQNQVLELLEQWLNDERFSEYHPQIEHLIENKYWDYLLDSFYQVIPFGTGGRRGEVGVGPNRINPYTVKAACQGHAQYLLKHYGEDAKKRGIALAYDVREFFGNKYLSDSLSNPVKNLKCRDLAEQAAQVYSGNGIKVYLFEDIRTTPELSFTIRHLNCVGGNVFSASHNPPEHNGQKVFDEFGGQLIPPDDEHLVNEVVEHVSKIEELDFEEAKSQGLIEMIGEEVDKKYLEAVSKTSLSSERDIKIVYTPLHGTGLQNVYKALETLGFSVEKDPKTSNPSGKFENVTFNIPNPEVEQSFETPLIYAKEVNADLLLSSDPDSDRFGAMINHQGQWTFLNGNQIAAILTNYVLERRKPTRDNLGIVIKTVVTTNLIDEIAKHNNTEVIGDLLVGYKYVGAEMNRLEKEGKIDNVLFSCEESHGYLAGSYARDKDSAPAAVLFSELAAELKKKDKTLIDYLNEVYAKYGYFRNYLTEIRLPGAEGKGQIDKIQETLRNNPPKSFGRFSVQKFEDYLNRKPILSETDHASKNVLVFYLEPVTGTISIKVTIRPSGTEPKTKMYFEIGSEPFELEKLEEVKNNIEEIRQELEKDILQACYRILGIDFPDRGFLLFWQLPLQDKLRYFEVEEKILELKDIEDKGERKQKLDDLLKFLGSDPIAKVDKAFQAEYKSSLKEYLEL
ncbi:phospho-sugar mutase [Candidatus Daviesbacteria bacterium]|nr:phospho-sugar mutase [Candidatus Daviesbacteria bacterium]